MKPWLKLKQQQEESMDKIVIGTVKSLTGGASVYEIVRSGTPRDQGGAGVRWSCSCPAYQKGRGWACKHLKGLWAGSLLLEAVELSEDGAAYVRREVPEDSIRCYLPELKMAVSA